MDSLSAGHCESSCQSLSLSLFCGVDVTVSELPFWLKPGAQFSPVGQDDAKKIQKGQTETGRLREAERKGLHPRIACGKACDAQNNSG